jgi:hypothetical protein
VTDYHYRPFQQLAFDVSNSADAADVTTGVLDKIELEARVAGPGKPEPIIEIALRGQLGFPNSALELQKIREQAAAATGALHIRIKNQIISTPRTYPTMPAANSSNAASSTT